MKTLLRRMFCTMLTLFMVLGLFPTTSMTAQAANYHLATFLPTNQNKLMPNGSTMDIETILDLDGSSVSGHYIAIDQTSYDANERAMLTLAVNGSTVTATANSNGTEGNVAFTLEAYVPGSSTPATTREMMISLSKDFYDFNPLLNISNPDIGDTIDLSQCVKLTHYTYVQGSNQANAQHVQIFGTSNYNTTITASNPGDWEINGSTVKRKTANFTKLTVTAKPANASDTYSVTYEFDALDYSISWGNQIVYNYKTDNILTPDITKLAGKNYDFNFILGRRDQNGFRSFQNQSALFTKVTDPVRGTATGININGAALSRVCQGNSFDLRTDILIDGQLANTWTETIRFDNQLYPLSLMGPSVNGKLPVYNDATNAYFELGIATPIPTSQYDVNFEVGTMTAGPSTYTPFANQANLFSKEIDPVAQRVTGIFVNAEEIAKLCAPNQNEFAIKIELMVGGYAITTSHVGFQFVSAHANYHYKYFDHVALPGFANVWTTVEYELFNGQNPDGIMGSVDVTNVSVNVTSGDPNAVKLLPDPNDPNAWNIVCSALGEAMVTITHDNFDGTGSVDHTYTIKVVPDIWETSWYIDGGFQNVLPGGSLDVEVSAAHSSWDALKGQYFVNSSYEAEWSMDPSIAPYVSLTYNNADHTDVTISVTSNIPHEDYDVFYDIYELDERGNRKSTPVASNNVHFVVMDDFPFLLLNGLTSDVEVGETITITPATMQYTLANPNGQLIPNATYSYWNDSDNVEIEEQNGSFLVTRLNSWDIWDCGISAEAFYAGDMCSFGNAFYFPMIDYSTSFLSLRGQDESTYLYDNEMYTLEADMTNLISKRATIGFDWIVGVWTDKANEEYDPVTLGYTTSGNKITLDGKALAAQGITDLFIAANATSNGYPTDGVAFTDVEVRNVPIPPNTGNNSSSTTVTPVVSQTAMNSAITETMNVVDAIDQALLNGEITVAPDGTIDKLPAALQGVIAKETAEAILEAKAAGCVISVDVVANTLTRNEALASSSADVAKLEAALSGNGTIAQFLDLSVMIQAVAPDGTVTNLGNLQKLNGEQMTFALVLPKNLNPSGKNFYVLRAHNGIVDKLPATTNADGTVSFTTDRYSTYALAYEEVSTGNTPSGGASSDTSQQTSAPASNLSPATGDSAHPALWVITISLMMGSLTAVLCRKKVFTSK